MFWMLPMKALQKMSIKNRLFFMADLDQSKAIMADENAKKPTIVIIVGMAVNINLQTGKFPQSFVGT